MDEVAFSSFTAAAVEVLREIGLQVDRIGVVPPTRRESDRHVAFVVMIGILGDLNGVLMLRFDDRAALNVVTAMYRSMGLEYPGPHGLGDTAIGELANQICGRAFTKLSGRNIDMTPPTVIEGTDFLPYLPGIPTLERRNIRGPFGTMLLALGLRG